MSLSLRPPFPPPLLSLLFLLTLVPVYFSSEAILRRWQQESHESHLEKHSSPTSLHAAPPNPAFSQQLEVSQLEGSLQQPKAQSAMSPYLVPDTQALCHHLPVIRQLATSGRFIVIIPRTGKCIGEVGAQSVAERIWLGIERPLLGPIHT